VPELRLADGREFSVRQVLNHTSGLDWGTLVDTGEGDDALRRHVAELAALKLVGEVGERPSYSQSGYNLAGRIIENVTVAPDEAAVWLADKVQALEDPEFQRIYRAYDEAFEWSPDDPRLPAPARRAAAWMVARPEMPAADPEITALAMRAAGASSPAWQRMASLGRRAPEVDEGLLAPPQVDE
jgi:hypothetical protein